MTVAIPLKKQSNYDELKFALRSVERHVKADVIIIGEQLPRWIDNVTWIKLGDLDGRKQLSVKRKILAALEYSEEILFSNDDIYFLKKTKVPYYWNGDLKGYSYTGSKELQADLKRMGKPTKSFELHTPLIFKQDFKEVIKKFSVDTLIRSAYCNYLEIEGERFTGKIDGQSAFDCKFVKAPKPVDVTKAIESMDFISTGVYSVHAVLPFLQQLFPTPSKFEI